MPNKRLKKINENEDSSSSTDGEDSYENNSDEEFDPNEEIMIDFEAREPYESDYDTVRLLLQQKLSLFSINLTDLTTIVVQQANIGNVIYQATNNNDGTNIDDNNNEDDTIFGVLSLIDLKSPKVKSFYDSFTNALVKECEKYEKSKGNTSENLAKKFKELLRIKSVSYVVNERFVNIPTEISVPMFGSLLSDIENIKKEKINSNEVYNEADYWLFISKIYTDVESKATSSKNSAASNNELANLMYSNPEEEVFDEFSELKFEINFSNNDSKNEVPSDDLNLQAFLKCFLLPKDKINSAITKIKSLVKTDK